MTLKLFWGFMPAEIRVPLRPILAQYLFIVPPYVERLYVRWQPAHEREASARAEMSTAPEYRFADVTFYGQWLADSEFDRRHSVVHELAHLVHARLGIGAKKFVEATLGDALVFRSRELERIRWDVEAATEDWTRILLSLPVESLPVTSFEEMEDEVPSIQEQLTAGRIAAADLSSFS